MPSIFEQILTGLILAIAIAWLPLKAHRSGISTALFITMALYSAVGIYRATVIESTVQEMTQSNLTDAREQSLRLVTAAAELFDGTNKTSTPSPFTELVSQYKNAADHDLSHVKEPTPTTVAYQVIVRHSMEKSISDQLSWLKENKTIEGPALAQDLSAIYGNDRQPAAQTEEDLKKRLNKSWYQEQALEDLYRKSHQTDKYDQLQTYQYNRNTALIWRLVGIFTTVILSVLIGVVVLIVLAVDTWRKRNKPTALSEGSHDTEIKVRFEPKLVLGIALTYVSFKVLLRNLFHDSFVGFYSATQNLWLVTLGLIALFIIFNGWPIAYLYFTVVKSQKIGFIDGFRLHMSTAAIGRTKMILNGFLSFFAMLPFLAWVGLVQSLLRLPVSANPIQKLETTIAHSSDIAAIGGMFLLVAVIGPMIEELICRGFLYSALRQKFSISVSVFVSSVFFTVLHFDPSSSLALMTFGIVFALATERFKSIVPAFIAHCLWNGSLFAVSLLLTRNL